MASPSLLHGVTSLAVPCVAGGTGLKAAQGGANLADTTSCRDCRRGLPMLMSCVVHSGEGGRREGRRGAAGRRMQHADERQCMYAASWQAADAHGRARAARPIPRPARIALSGRCGSGDPGNFLLVAPAAAGAVAGLDAGLARRAAELGPGPLRVSLAARAAAGPAAAAARATALQVQVLQAVLSPGGGGGRGPGPPGRGGSPGSSPDVQLVTRGAQLGAQPGCYGRSGALGGVAGSRAAEGAAAAALLRVAAAESPALAWRSTDISPAAAAPLTAAGGDVYGRSLQVRARFCMRRAACSQQEKRATGCSARGTTSGVTNAA
jgi:hypothetical protein